MRNITSIHGQCLCGKIYMNANTQKWNWENVCVKTGLKKTAKIALRSITICFSRTHFYVFAFIYNVMRNKVHCVRVCV